MGSNLIAAVGIIAGIVLLVMLYYTGSGNPNPVPGTTTTMPFSAATTTTTTVQSIGSSIGSMKASNTSAENIAWLELRTFELVNYERTSHGLSALQWSDTIASVARAHSADMALNAYFSHTGSDGSNVSSRLQAGGVYDWNESAENILEESGVSYYMVNILGIVRQTEYKTFEQLAQNATQGWMNSTGHRENILTPTLDRSGMGVYQFNGSYYLTQDFVTTVSCGFKAGPCCVQEGYYPWCYVPWKCKSGLCR